MHLTALLQQHQPSFSFEFFPPKSDEAVGTLMGRATELAALKPAFVSVTYGAGGSTRLKTLEVIMRLKRELDVNAAAHLTCVGHNREELVGILHQLKDAGVQNIVALRGDAPIEAGATFTPHPNGLRYAAELVQLIRSEFGDTFGIAVAGYPEGHPETPDKLADLDHLRAKVDQGADAIVTQLFFDNRDFFDFRDRCELAGIRVPIIAGLMPIVSHKGILRMAGLCGSRLPAPLLAQLQKAKDDDAQVARIGTQWATQQARELIEQGVRGIHFYTLNRSGATVEIYQNLGAADSAALAAIARPGDSAG